MSIDSTLKIFLLLIKNKDRIYDIRAFKTN